MKKRSLISQVIPSFMLVAVVAIVAVASYATILIRSFHHDHVRVELASSARILAEYYKTILARDKGGISVAEGLKADVFCKAFGKGSGYRMTFMMPDGRVIGDSEEDPAVMENHADRPEVRDAMIKGAGVSTRYSRTLGQRMMYVAVSVTGEDRQIIGVVRTSLSLSVIDETIALLWHRIAFACLVVVGVAFVVGVFVSRRIIRPLSEIRFGAEAIGNGNLKERIPSSGLTEIDILADTINRMADQLNDRINAVTQQRDEQNALFSCMVEGVFAVDAERRLIKMNKSAQNLFNADDSDYGRNVMEVVRNNDLLDVVTKALASADPVEGDVFLQAEGLCLHAHGTVLNGTDGQRLGALVVLYDVTRLNKLEEMRRDFVANVSHELKTPITAISGFVDTLLDCKVKDSAEVEKFLRIVGKQANRLTAIVEDLLTLSRLEEDSHVRTIPMELMKLENILHEAIEVCSHKARAKKIEIKVQCGPALEVSINPVFFEQAIVNLVDNAIKYSAEGSSVEVDAGIRNGRVVVRIKDHGTGIEKVHIPRIFERFYRVDKARSRQLGGTGLGLSIVKHIVLMHKGEVRVESVLGEGSTFSILIPAPY